MMKILFSLLLLLFAAVPSLATTHYIRLDGGNQTQCTGLVNAAYPGSGTAQPCAVNHPFWLLNQSTWAWLTAANDTIQFGDLGPYYMGQGRNGHGQTWSHCSGGESDCDLPALPSGTRMLGLNAGGCHSIDHSGLVNPTQLLGINHVFRVLDIEGVNAPDIECLDISSSTTCTVQGQQANIITNTSMTGGVATYTWSYSGFNNKPTVGMPVTVTGTTNGGGVFNIAGRLTLSAVTDPGGTTGTFTVGGFSGDVASASDTGTETFTGSCVSATNDGASNGIVMSYIKSHGPSNATLKDLAIHGMRADGIMGMYLNTAPDQVFTASDIILSGNGSAGLDADGGGCGTSCESQGTMNISYLTATWNGCVEVEPNGGTIGGNGYNYCVDQAFNGYGDGVTMIAENGTWNWSHITSNFNAQDGFDSLHIGDDTTIAPIVNMDYIYAEGNEGQSIKGGGGNATLTNSIGIANCDVFADAANFPLNPPGWNALTQQRCRANDAMAFGMHPGSSLTIRYVTNVVEQNVSWDFANGGCDATCTLTFENNTTVGYVSPYYGTLPGSYEHSGSGPDPFTNGTSSVTSASWFDTTSCPFVGSVCSDPKFVSEADVNAVNVNLLATSPLLGAGVAISGVTTDYANNPRPNPPSIGALQLAPPVPTPPASVFGGGSVFAVTQ